jgi:hypothetical protein
MGQPRFLEFLFTITLYTFASCDCALFIAFTLGLTFHTVKLIISFCRDGAGRHED